jgi:biopolymer transport protein ExbD
MNVGGDTGENGRSQDFDLNLAPIIDCFTVLITFLLVSASFLAVGIFDANLAIEGPPPANTQPPAIRVDLELLAKHRIRLRVTGKSSLDKTLEPLDEDWDLKALTTEIDALVAQWPDTRSVVLNGHDDLEYRHVVRIMETVKGKLPSILLGGL